MDTNLDLLNVIKANRPNLSYNSYRTYISSINRLSVDINSNLNSVIEIMINKDKILEALNKYNPQAKKTRISALISVLDNKNEKIDDTTKKFLETLRDLMYESAEIIKQKDSNQELTEEQKKNFISWDEVMKIYYELKKVADPVFKLNQINSKDWITLLSFVLLSCLVLIPPRRAKDYYLMKIRNFDSTPEGDDNFVHLSKYNKAKFVFKNYKNAKKVGTQVVEIPMTLKTILLKWKNINPHDWLLPLMTENKPISQQRITTLLNNIFKKNISVSMLRHIYLTHKFGNINLKDLLETTEQMGNTEVQRTLSYVSRDNAVKEKEVELEEIKEKEKENEFFD